MTLEYAVDSGLNPCWDITFGAYPQAWVKPSTLIVHSQRTVCHVSGLVGMVCYQTGVSGAQKHDTQIYHADCSMCS